MANLPQSINDFNIDENLNFPANSDLTGTTVAELPRLMQSIIKKQFSKGAALTILANGTLTVPASEGYYPVLGTGFSITGLSTAFEGKAVRLRFQAGNTLVHSTAFNLPYGQNITTYNNDILTFVYDGGAWYCADHQSSASAANPNYIRKPDLSSGGSVAFAAAPVIPATGHLFTITSAGTITGLGSANSWDGRVVHLTFAAGTVLKNSATLLLPNAADITTVAGDMGSFIQLSSGVWECQSYNSQSAGLLKQNSVRFEPDSGNFGMLFGPKTGAGAVTFEIGAQAGGGNAALDFHTGTPSNANFDSRIFATGGDGTLGGGTIAVSAKSFTLNSNPVDAFPSGTRLVFAQAAAPAGWSIVSGLTNRTLVIGASGGVSGGTAAHNLVAGCTVVASHTHVTDPAAVIGTTSSDAHTHTYADAGSGNGAGGFSDGTGGRSVTRTTSSDAHSHTVSINIPSTTSKANAGADVWKPLYVTTIICSKN